MVLYDSVLNRGYPATTTGVTKEDKKRPAPLKSKK